MNTQNLVQFYHFVQRNFEQSSDINEGHNSITNAWKMICNNPNLDLININAYTKFGKIVSICSQDIEQKQNFERNSDINEGP